MIIRIHGSGQYRLDDEAQRELDALDEQIVGAVERHDVETTHALLRKASAFVESHGSKLSEAELSPSDIILPDPDADFEEIQAEVHSLIHAS